MLKIGDTLPNVILTEYIEEPGSGCNIGPNPLDVVKVASNKTIAILALPGAFTPTCSAQHVPGYIALFEEFKSAGVDEIWCISVNDAYVMGAWARDQKSAGKVRMLGDGSAQFTHSMGLILDLTKAGMGIRSQRYSMLVVNGKIETLNVEAPGQFAVSDAKTMLSQVKSRTV